MSRRVSRWHAALSGAGVLVTVGVLAAQPFLLVAATVPLWYVLVGALSRVPSGASLQAERKVTATNPHPGRPIEVELTIENVGDRTLADVRVVDGVPEALTVVEGSPRLATALRPGDRTTVSYSVAAKRGTYEFDAPVARLRPLAATDVASAQLPVTGDEALTAGHAVSRAPLPDHALPRAGTHATDAGGEGTEFHATREYRPGDSVHRIDWRGYAKTGDLATVEYRAERAARTVLIVDARPCGRVTPAPGYPTGVELGTYAAERLFHAFESGDVTTSVVAIGLDDEEVPGGLDPDGLAWVDASEEGLGTARVEQVFGWLYDVGDRRGPAEASEAAEAAEGEDGASADETATPDESGTTGEETAVADGGGASVNGDDNGDGDARGGDDDGTERIGRLLARLHPSAQVVLVSPFLDDWPVDLVASLTAHGHPTTVLSPDATGGESIGRRTVALERAVRVRSLPTATAVVDWDVDQPLDAALGRSSVGGFDA